MQMVQLGVSALTFHSKLFSEMKNYSDILLSLSLANPFEKTFVRRSHCCITQCHRSECTFTFADKSFLLAFLEKWKTRRIHPERSGVELIGDSEVLTKARNIQIS